MGLQRAATCFELENESVWQNKCSLRKEIDAYSRIWLNITIVKVPDITKYIFLTLASLLSFEQCNNAVKAQRAQISACWTAEI